MPRQVILDALLTSFTALPSQKIRIKSTFSLGL